MLFILEIISDLIKSVVYFTKGRNKLITLKWILILLRKRKEGYVGQLVSSN